MEILIEPHASQGTDLEGIKGTNIIGEIKIGLNSRAGNEGDQGETIIKEGGCSDQPFGSPFWQPHHLQKTPTQ
jgi:hypothetical protein